MPIAWQRCIGTIVRKLINGSPIRGLATKYGLCLLTGRNHQRSTKKSYAWRCLAMKCMTTGLRKDRSKLSLFSTPLIGESAKTPQNDPHFQDKHG
jgi:hypothetical protein